MNAVFAERYSLFTALTVGAANRTPFTGLTSYTLAMLTVEGGSAMRYRLDGTAATSGSGHLVGSGVVVNLIGSDCISGFNVICTTETGVIMASLGTR